MFNHRTAVEPGKSNLLYRASDQIELVDKFTSSEPQTMSGLVLQSPRDPAPPVTLELSMPSDQPQPFAHVLKATDESLPKYFPSREISATRTYPPGCGRNIQGINTDEISATTRASPPGWGRNVQVTRASPPGRGRNVQGISNDKVSATTRASPPSWGRSVQGTRASPPGWGRNAQGISTDEMSATKASPPSRGRNVEGTRASPSGWGRNVRGISTDEISATMAVPPPGFGRNVQSINTDEISATKATPPGCGRNARRISTDDDLNSVSSEKGNSYGREKTISELSLSEKIVRNGANHAGEKVLDGYVCRKGKQVATYYLNGTNGMNVKKQKLMVMGKSISASIEKKQKTENLGRLTTEKKVPLKGKVAYFDPGQAVAKHKDDNVGGDENVINGCKAIVSHDRAIKTLNLFRNILKEEGRKSKEQVNWTYRIDLLAFDRLKRTNMWINPGIAILGSIPGVEVGDKFRYRVELKIVGLHRHLESGIDYLKKGGKIIATSIVASGGYDNDTSDSDVLIYSGQGGKQMKGDMPPKNQKLERGNLALKNSIDEKNAVRVIFGSEQLLDSYSMDARGKIVSCYVYNGLYLVEKYWKKTGDYGNIIFKFQLRKLRSRLELHSMKN